MIRDKGFKWRVYTMSSGNGGRVAMALIGEFKTKREAVACIPANARNVVRNGRDYLYTPVGR